MPSTVLLNGVEIAALDRQDPSTAQDGGFQAFMVKLQKQLNRETDELSLDHDDLEKIPRYAYDYGNGGWQDRLEQIFSRTLGPRLGRATHS